MAQLISVKLNKPDGCPLGFRLQGGKDFGAPLVIQKVNGGSPAEKAGLLAGDSVIKVNSTDVYNLRHKEAQDVIVRAGQNMDITVQRGGSTWKPSVTAVSSIPSPVPSAKLPSCISPVTQTSLKANQQPTLHIGSAHNNQVKPFNYMNGNGDSTVKSIVNKQYNTPVGMYSEETIAETLSAQAEVLAGGVLGVNFKKNEKTYDAEKSEVFKMLQEADNDPEPEATSYSPAPPSVAAVAGLRHVVAPVTKPDAPVNNTGGLPPGQNICEECERLIIGVFVRIKDKNLHVECFKCATCGSSLKNQGYYNLNGKLYCDIHAKMVARQNPPASNLEPMTFPGGKGSANTISSALSSHTVPLPPLTTTFPPPNPAGNGLSFMPMESHLSEDQFDSTLNLNQETVDTFTTMMKNEKETKEAQFSHSNSSTLERAQAGIKPATNGQNGSANHYANGSANGLHDTVVNSGYKKVIPPHMGGSFKANANAPGPRPFGSSAPLSPAAPLSTSSLSPRSVPSAPISPAQRAYQPPAYQAPAQPAYQAPAQPAYHAPTQPAYQAPAPQAMPAVANEATNNSQLLNAKLAELSANGITKNAIMKQLSKHAFDGKYEIGIQRKIKPGDHIASMASKIKDTVVLKHPLNNTNLECLQNDNKNHNHFNPTYHAKTDGGHNQKNNSNDKLNSPQLIMNKNNYNGGIPPPPPPPPKFKSDSLSPASTRTGTNSSPSLSQHSSPFTSLSGSGSLSPANEKTQHDTSNLPPRQLTSALLNKMILKNAMERESAQNHMKQEPKINFVNGNGINANGLTNVNGLKNTNIIKNGCSKDKIIDSDSLSKVSKLHNTENIISHTVNHVSTDQSKGLNKMSNGNSERITNSVTKTEKNPYNNTNTDSNENSPVKLRSKDNAATNMNGKRDSHMTSRPLSTVVVDHVDGVYPICNQCNKEITRGPFITALGRIWCPEHFVCVNNTCRRHLQDIGFVEENGQLYCEYCFEQFIAPACDKCHGKIKGDCLNAIGKHFHPECFNCAYCGKLFGNNPFFLEEGLPYCEADWNELFTTKCFACGFPVEAGDRWVEALNNNYHSQCFNCTMCKKNLEGQSFYAKGGRPFCKTHAR